MIQTVSLAEDVLILLSSSSGFLKALYKLKENFCPLTEKTDNIQDFNVVG